MRTTIPLILGATLIWLVWWVVGSYGMVSALKSWLAQRSEVGWQADVATIDIGSDPTRLGAVLTDLQLADPDTGVAIAFPTLALMTPLWWSGNISLNVPDEPILVASPFRRRHLRPTGATGVLTVAAQTKLELQSLEFRTNALELSDDDGALFRSGASVVNMTRGENVTYDISLGFTDFGPAEGWSPRFQRQTEWPQTFETLRARGTVTFDRPWDRTAIEQSRPQPRRIDLKLAEATWADLHLKLAASLAINEEGLASGHIDVQARQWAKILDLASETGLIPPVFRDRTERALGRVAQLRGRSETLDFRLTLRDGRMFLGPIAVGWLPSFRIR